MRGRPLEQATRAFFEPRLGHDFAGVRVHTDERADAAARSYDALAYTVGSDVVFRAGRYAPNTAEGRRLLGHELTHVVQAQAASRGAAGRRESSRNATAATANDGPAELQAARASAAIAGGRAFHLHPIAFAGVARQPAERERPDELIAGMQAFLRECKALDLSSPLEAPIKERAQARREGKLQDLTGVGAVKSADRFAKAMHELRKKWSTLSATTRLEWIRKAANVELAAAAVPEFGEDDVSGDDTGANFGVFTAGDWTLAIDETLLEEKELSDAQAAELANTVLHEVRHAEQAFLAARFSAGVKNSKAGKIKRSLMIPKRIARRAVADPFDSATDPVTAKLGETMEKTSGGRAGRANDRITKKKDRAADRFQMLRDDFETALTAFENDPTKRNERRATRKQNALRAQLAIVKEMYPAYRSQPDEVDANEAGYAAEEALRDLQQRER